MTARERLPTAYADFLATTFAKDGHALRDPALLFEAAEAVEAIDECEECAKPVINLTAFVEGIGEHYLLTDELKERLEAELANAGVEVSDEGTCSEHTVE